MHIEQIKPQLTWQLRRDVLYPEGTIREMEMDEDNHGYHFAAFINNKIVGVASLFQNGTDWQFRKFAFDTNFQGMGYGRLLLDYITNFVKAEGAERLWCNARKSAIGFYLKSGFVQTGETFSKAGIDYEIIEKVL